MAETLVFFAPRLFMENFMNHYETRVYREMVFIVPKGKRWTKRNEAAVLKQWKNRRGWLIEDVPGMSSEEQIMRFQLSYNHMHLGNKKEVNRICNEVTADFTERYPKLAYYLAVDWRGGGKREPGNNVMISFWLDMPRKKNGQHRSENKKVSRTGDRGTKKRSRRIRGTVKSTA